VNIASELELLSSSSSSPPYVGLTDQDREILELAQQGKTDQEIADILDLSLDSLQHCLLRMCAKLNVTSTDEAVTIAVEVGVLPSHVYRGLSEREKEILRLARDGLTNSEIATKLGLSDGTVRNCLSGIYTKLKVRNRTEAIKTVLQLELL